ncbi:MAG: cupredoxin family copper-binding protein [Burkholderiales bacterium]
MQNTSNQHFSSIARAMAACRIATAILLAAWLCMGPDTNTAEPAKSTVHNVTIDAMKYLPDRLTVHAGDTVVWINKDLFPHTVTEVKGRFDSHEIKPNASWRYVAKKRGEFAYVCTLHPSMKGALLVE